MDKRTTRHEQKIAQEYLCSLGELKKRKKSIIQGLTNSAKEHTKYAPIIVMVIQEHILKTDPNLKLPVLYLIGSIVKNINKPYPELFSKFIIDIFCGVFKEVDEKSRGKMRKLRKKWKKFFSAKKLDSLDVAMRRIDKKWPVISRREMNEIIQQKSLELLELQLSLANFNKELEEEEKLTNHQKKIIHNVPRNSKDLQQNLLTPKSSPKHLSQQEKPNAWYHFNLHADPQKRRKQQFLDINSQWSSQGDDNHLSQSQETNIKSENQMNRSFTSLLAQAIEEAVLLTVELDSQIDVCYAPYERLNKWTSTNLIEAREPRTKLHPNRCDNCDPVLAPKDLCTILNRNDNYFGNKDSDASSTSLSAPLSPEWFSSLNIDEIVPELKFENLFENFAEDNIMDFGAEDGVW